MITEIATPSTQVQVPTVKDQAGKILAHVAGYVGSRTIEIGLASGLVATLAERNEGLTAAGLAAAAEMDPLYVEVWCRSALANDVLERTDDGGYRLAPHMRTILLDRESAAYVGGTLSVLAQPEIFDRFGESLASGARTWWDQVGPGFIEGVSSTGSAFYTRLVPGGLDRVAGLADTMADGARILDTACGAGVGLVRLAAAYPTATLVGADGDAYSLQLAAERLRQHGIEDRVELVHTALEELDRQDEFDLVVNNISMHECRDQDAVTRNIARALKPGGRFVISDFPFPTTDQALRSVPGRIMSGIQFFEAQIDDQLEPVATYLDLLDRHGFRDVDSFEVTPVHAITHGRK
ncbi:MAG TPA: class I SAM-dependent methyltransferase [Candidatus Deferrimicrobium sp.]|nr:class I SAM-dependent methyltransferase [Candidatus Deferrimicrobium sp.]